MFKSQDFSVVKKILSAYNFSNFNWVYCRPTIADLYKPDKRCGLYIFHFCNNEFYVGQAVDVVRRYVQHSKTHNDIQEISFKTFPERLLDEKEQELLKILEYKKIKLRNISLTSIPKGETDLELIIPLSYQEKWLNKNSRHKVEEHQIEEPKLQRKYHQKFLHMQSIGEFNDCVLPFLKEYFSKCIIQPTKTELSFWSLTCLPKIDNKFIVFCRLNLFWQEVLTISLDKKYKKIRYSFHLAESLLTKTYLKGLSKSILTLGFDDHYYPRGGPDQFNLWVHGFDDAMEILEDNLILKSIKKFNLRQMRKGATVYGRYHCIDLAKLVLRKVTTNIVKMKL